MARERAAATIGKRTPTAGAAIMQRRNNLLAGTVIPVVIGFGVVTGSGQGSAGLPEGENPTAVPRPYDAGAFQSAS